MPAFNSITLVGRLGKDPEFNFTPNGTATCKIVLAVDDFIAKDKKETYWFNVVFFGSLAEIVEKYLQKGSCVLVHGKITIRPYKDKEGNSRTWTEVVASSMQMLDKKPSTEKATTRAPLDRDFFEEDSYGFGGL